MFQIRLEKQTRCKTPRQYTNTNTNTDSNTDSNPKTNTDSNTNTDTIQYNTNTKGWLEPGIPNI